jgi:hypothetical protein
LGRLLFCSRKVIKCYKVRFPFFATQGSHHPSR